MTRALQIALVLTAFSSVSALGQSREKFSGVTAYYSPDYKGRTASGEQYDPLKFTAAHKTLPFGTVLRVTDQRSGRSVLVVVNDRGPFTKGRDLDVSLAAAKELRLISRGLMKITAEVQPASALKASADAKPTP